MNAEIISIGSDFINGDSANLSAHYLSRELSAIGITVHYQTSVGDSIDLIQNALRIAKDRSNIVFAIGGLGNFNGSYAVEIIAKALKIPLVLHEETLNHIKTCFENAGKPEDSTATRLSMLPQKSIVFQNDMGIAPGYAFACGKQLFVVLPEKPEELTAMFDDKVKPFLGRFSESSTVTHTMNVFGISESKTRGLLSKLPKSPDIDINIYTANGECTVRIISHSNTKQEAQKHIEPYIQKIRELLGQNIYGENADSLQQTVVNLLRRKDITISTAESCTAGLISKCLTEIPGSSEVFLCGVAAYSNNIKKSVLGVKESTIESYGAVSYETAAAMAIGARQISGATLGLGVTGIAGPDGGTEEKPVGLVYIALADGGRVWIKKIQAAKGRDRDYIRSLAAANAMDLIRRYLDCLPELMPGSISLNTYKTNPEFIDAITPVVISNKKARRKSDLDVIAVVEDESPTPPRSAFSNIFIPHSGDATSELVRKWIVISLAVIVVIISAFLLIYRFYPRQSDALEPSSTIPVSVPSSAPQSQLESKPEFVQPEPALFANYLAANDETLGRIAIDGTTTEYPILYTRVADYYLSHNFSKQLDPEGALSFNVANLNPARDKNILINGMTTAFTQYEDIDFYNNHPTLTMDTLDRIGSWQIFAIGYLNEDSIPAGFDHKKLSFANDSEFLTYVQELKSRSIYTIPANVTSEDQLMVLTVSPDTSKYDRLFIAARRINDGETLNDSAKAVMNKNVILPKANVVSSTVSDLSSQESDIPSSEPSSTSSQSRPSSTTPPPSSNEPSSDPTDPSSEPTHGPSSDDSDL